MDANYGVGLCNIPYIHAEVRADFLHGGDPKKKREWVECYIFAATALENRPLLFTIHTVHGAIFSRLPVWAFRTKPMGSEWDPRENGRLQPWACLGERLTVVEHRYLKDYEAFCRALQIHGRYRMTFDFLPSGGLEEDPGQHKTMNLIELNNGQLALLPNNECEFHDKHFAEITDEPSAYKRNKTYFMTED